MPFPDFGNEPAKPKSCAHGYTIDDPNPHNLCPFCPQPNRAQIVKAWKAKHPELNREPKP